MIERTLLRDFMAAYPAQPATAFWRAIEIGALVRHGLPEGTGLDFGCGDGILTDILLRHAGSRPLIGIDIDPLEIAAARRFPFYERLHHSPDGSVPEPDGSLDFALSNSVLEHVDDLDAALAEIARVLKPKGRFLFTVPAPAFRDLLAGSVLPGADRETYLATLDRRIAHRNYLDGPAWTKTCSAHGLDVEACETYLEGRQVRRWENLSRMTGGLLYTILGERSRPIEIQRDLGLRDPTRPCQWPAPIASLLGNIAAFGIDLAPPRDQPLAPDAAACLLVFGTRA
ncbi:class I SAM-dependent methyltransferase [Methylobacterium sp. E-016]|uniref:class I SAM-dependent methyltransferase n=1 Tax=Methylobacterium sp. E-016 TaxID=2836556 RepID=UPI001FB93228|nr:class I SAM-dependent methyltransferase [Methylobacterium sp. E-016]MCJ2079364.1 class I SAM-dependent methyltransferase [Methylobacterium sp. E-016]